MYNSYLKLTIGILVMMLGCNKVKKSESGISDYKNPILAIDVRVNDLLAQMSLEEKVAQMASAVGGSEMFFDSTGKFDPTIFETRYPHGIGLIGLFDMDKTMDIRTQAVKTNQILNYFLKKGKGIPPIIVCEGLHGFMSKGATSFPQSVALASTWDTTLVEEIFTTAAREMRLRGCTQVFSPVVDLGREPRWGRVEETYGEDPYLVARLGVAAVNGFQGRNAALGRERVCATMKHFSGHGGPENGTNIAPAPYGERTMRENYLYPFECAIKESKALSVMASYNEWDGMPSHANEKLLSSILRSEWGFEGYVTGDLGGMEELVSIHSVAADSAVAAKMSVEAGVDLELIKYKGCVPSLAPLVQQGRISPTVIDNAVARILSVKFRLGLFENPYADTVMATTNTNGPLQRALALKAAEKSVVLLKNTGNVLPLDIQKIKQLAVIGPNAADIHLGGYSFEPRSGVSVLEGLQKKSEGKFAVAYAKGCGITQDQGCFWACDSNKLSDPALDSKLISEAVRLAKKSDAIILVLGENESTCREAWSESHRGDRASLDLLGRQNELAAAVIATGKPVVVVLINGRPLSINYLANTAPAILEGFYLGQETGHAIANVIFGDVNPGGKLPITFPKSAGHLPVFYNKKPSRHRSYIFSDNAPLYPFGHGLSYTSFSYGPPMLSAAKIKIGSDLKVALEITNTGKVKGDEVVQLYLRDKVSSVTRPIIELKGFARITLAPGQAKKITFHIKPEHLQFYDTELKRIIEPGTFEVLIGSSCIDIRQKVAFEVTD